MEHVGSWVLHRVMVLEAVRSECLVAVWFYLTVCVIDVFSCWCWWSLYFYLECLVLVGGGIRFSPHSGCFDGEQSQWVS